ncbi:unnamed protein product [Musa hybrid cultivar]
MGIVNWLRIIETTANGDQGQLKGARQAKTSKQTFRVCSSRNLPCDVTGHPQGVFLLVFELTLTLTTMAVIKSSGSLIHYSLLVSFNALSLFDDGQSIHFLAFEPFHSHPS